MSVYNINIYVYTRVFVCEYVCMYYVRMFV